ncbi:LLM class flavin-dependent oxidoreductase [Rathayibacter sp. VKM Ac-2803]|uniref:LLM class flavin-dependent oxidoreductase n=1 Tax=Rathayibacter sp. VKM Ac-2803 TaxID=2609256 RepID=UPI00135CEDE7|nr:LLM class flavin-dependent oxidoreductase [Rathayibacter sp. VKM Ac-2803]MWV48274.1 LLM class flavin-dependent oxidoreductase [Rathayibacter sp. VKM Ac-2803]
MIVTALLSLDPGTTLDPGTALAETVEAAAALERAGVAAVAVLDAAGSGGVAPFESTTLAAHLAMTTSTIGIIAANSALYGFPYHAARRLATLDHLAQGRSGWLLRTVTGPAEASAYDWRSRIGPADELHRATEYAEIALELWDSWEDGSQWPDAVTGDFKDDARIHPIDYRSTSFRVAGPLDVPPSPARRPVLFGSIGSEDEAARLAPVLDVGIVVARDRSEAERLVAATRGVPLALLAIAASAGGDGLTVGPAGSIGVLVDELGVDGVCLSGPLSAAGGIASLAQRLGAARDGGPTLADALGITDRMSYGGRAA